MAKALNKKIFVVAVGIGPFVTEKQIDYTRNTLKKCDYVTFRDEKSFEYMKENGKYPENMFLSIDPVFIFGNKLSIPLNKTKNKIGICIIDYRLTRASENSYKKYLISLASLINKISKELDCSIELFSTEEIDYNSVFDVHNLVEDKEAVSIRKINSIDELISLYSELDLVLGTRMHSMIIAASQSIPIVGLSWQQKVNQMFRILEDENSVFDIEKIEEEEDSIISIIFNKIENKEKEKNKLEKLRTIAEKKFEINYKIIEKISQEK